MFKQDVNHHEEHKEHEVDTLDFFYCFVSLVIFVVSKTEPKCNGLMRTYECFDVLGGCGYKVEEEPASYDPNYFDFDEDFDSDFKQKNIER